jgi:cytochrome c oxidase cbb3-type subunit 4
MNVGVLSGLVTGVLLVAFLAGWCWVWSARRRPEFEAAARLPLDEIPTEPRA